MGQPFKIIMRSHKTNGATVSGRIATLLLLLTCCDVRSNPSSCDFEPCLDTYNSLKSLYDTYRTHDVSKILPGVISTICAQQNELKDCTKKQSRSCRGDLNYHFFVRLAQRIQTENSQLGNNCSSEVSGSTGTMLTPPSHGHSNHGGSSRRAYATKCTSKYGPTDPSVGCALYGLTNLKSFSDPLNLTDVPYCSLSGAWSLLDTDAVAVQITNKGGLSPLPKDITTTTLVTVIVKNNECAERKTFQATFDEVPAMFSDGSTTAGSVYIEEVKRSEHVRIHFPYVSTIVEIIRVLGHLPISTLSVTIKMPEAKASNMSTTLDRSTKGIPLCFYGCPKTANIKPRSIDPAHRCPLEDHDDDELSKEEEESSASTEFMDTANSITSAICDSLANVQNILRETSMLDSPRLRMDGEENWVSTQNDGGLPPPASQQRHHQNNHSRFPTGIGNSGVSQSVVYNHTSLYLIGVLIIIKYAWR